MTIAFASSMNSVPWGGSEILWYETAEQLAKAGHRLALVTPPWPDIPTPILKARTEWKIDHTYDLTACPARLVRRIANRLPGGQGLTFRGRWLRTTEPKILCLSNGNAFQGLDWMEAAIAEEVPFVTIAQAHADFLAPGDTIARRLIEAFSAARANYFVARSNQELVECQLGWRFPNARLIANHSRYLTTTGPVPWPESAEDTLRLACVARLHPPSKGQDLLFTALADPRWHDRKVEVSLLGTGDQEHCLRRLASLLGISHRIRFLGHSSNTMAIWETHHALILPSRYEGTPLVLMEAMLAGRPVITTAVAGAPELIDHGRTGFLAEAATTQHLQQCLEEAWTQRGYWRSIGLAAHSYAKERARVPPAQRLAAELLELAAR